MAVVYPDLGSAEFAADFGRLAGGISDLSAMFDRYSIERSESIDVVSSVVQAFESVVTALNDIEDRFNVLDAYIHAFIATDSRDDRAQARQSELEQQDVILSQLSARFTAWIGSFDVEQLQSRSETARDYSFLLQQAGERSRHLMSPAEEALAAELEVTGGDAWARLYGNVASQLLVDVEVDGERPVPMSIVRNMALSADRDTRRRGFEAELCAWQGAGVTLAAALNSIKGETNTLCDRRGWPAPLDAALFGNNIDRPTLDAMLNAARASFPDFRRYLHAKARVLGVERLAFYDLFAPVVESDSTWEFDEARGFIVEQFKTYSARMSDFAERAFRERWIDAGPRPGKSGGAFCMSLRKDESRILANYIPSYDCMSTLAHELGHGYHNLAIAHRPALQRGHPMTLAETASIFCQTIVEQAALRNASTREQLAIVESALQDQCQVVVDITSRFLFEEAVLERRRKRELSVEELNQIMLDAQRETYGDGLDPNALHPYMWAAKSHYYSSSFYNYPYMFGLLFGLGLYGQYKHDPQAFVAKYDELLSSTGVADVATLAFRFGIDVRDEGFWISSLDTIREGVERFEALIDEGSER